jgi:conjugative transposon TraK protein
VVVVVRVTGAVVVLVRVTGSGIKYREVNMLEKLKAVEDGYKRFRVLMVVVLLFWLTVSGLLVWSSLSRADRAAGRIYVLAGGAGLPATIADQSAYLAVEARDHLRNFHRLFFDLTPDEKAIKASIDRSFYLADGSVKKLYDNLLESGFINGLISGNITQSVVLDSISVDLSQEPYRFQCVGVQTLIRSTSLTTRTFVTTGVLRRSGLDRSDNNPHGMLIEKFVVEQNKEVKTIKR